MIKWNNLQVPVGHTNPTSFTQFADSARRTNSARSYKLQHLCKQYLPNTQSTLTKNKTKNIYDNNSHMYNSKDNPSGKRIRLRNLDPNPNDNDTSNFNDMLEINRQLAKNQIQEQSDHMREKLWFSIEKMFRDIAQYSDQFYQGLYTILNTHHYHPNSHLSNKQTIHQLQLYLTAQLRKNKLLYNRVKMENFIQDVISKIECYLSEIQDSKLEQLFEIPKQSNQMEQIRYEYKHPSKISNQHQSLSVDKSHHLRKTNYKLNNTRQLNERKEREFKDLYERILENKIQRNLMKSFYDNSSNVSGEQVEREEYNRNKIGDGSDGWVDCCDEQVYSDDNHYYNQYGLSNENFIQNARQKPSPTQIRKTNNISYHSHSHQNLHNFNHNPSKNYPNQLLPSYQNSLPNSISISKIQSNSNICDRVLYNPNISHHIVKQPILNFTNNFSNPHSNQHTNHNFHKSQYNTKNVSIQEIKAYIKKKQSSKYLLDNNQQSITCDWCEQICIESQISTIDVTNARQSRVQDKSSSMSELSAVQKNISKNLQKPKSNPKKQKKLQPLLLCVTYCNNFSHLAIGCKNGLIAIYSTQSSQLVTKLEGHISAVTCLHSNSHNNLLFSGGDTPCNCIIIWNTNTWTIRSKLSLHSAALSSLVYIPHTDYLVSTSFDRTLKLYNYLTSTVTDMYISSGIMFTKVVYYEQLQILVAMTPSKIVRLWEVNMNNGERFRIGNERVITCGGKVTNIEKAVSKDRNLLLIGLHNGFIEIFKLPQTSKVRRMEVNKSAILNMLAFSRNSKSQHPLILAVCYTSKVFHLVNTQSGLLFQLNIKGNLDINFTQGIGPVLVANQKQVIAWVDQNQDNALIHFAKFAIY